MLYGGLKMKLKTRYFGELEIDEKKILTFERGLLGFEDVKRYVLIPVGDGSSPFSWLQSVDDGNLAFVVVNPFMIKGDYDFEISDDIVEKLEIADASDIVVLAVVVVPDDMAKMTMNLKAPLIINTRNNKGAQTVLDTAEYSVRHYIMEELRGQEVAENAGSDAKERAVACYK